MFPYYPLQVKDFERKNANGCSQLQNNAAKILKIKIIVKALIIQMHGSIKGGRSRGDIPFLKLMLHLIQTVIHMKY